MSGYALQANPTYAAGSSSLRPAPSSLRPAPVSLQPGSSSLRPGLRRTRTRGQQRIPPGAMAHRYNGEMSGYAALTRIWTPPVLPARMLDDKGVDCSRISGLLVGRSGPGHDELSARLLLIDLACSRHIGFGRVFRRRFDRFVIGDSCWAIVRKVLLLKLSS